MPKAQLPAFLICSGLKSLSQIASMLSLMFLQGLFMFPSCLLRVSSCL